MTSTVGAYEAAVLAKMLFKTHSKVGEDPNYIELSKLQREVYQNCAAVTSSMDGNNGHLGLVMPAAQYAAHTCMLHPPIIQGTTIPLLVLTLTEYYRVKEKLPINSA